MFLKKIIAFFGSLYLPSLNPFIVRCFVTAVLSLILLTSAYPLRRHAGTRAGTSVSACVCCCVYTRVRTRIKKQQHTSRGKQKQLQTGSKKDKSHCCCVGVTRLSSVVPTPCDSSGKRSLRGTTTHTAQTGFFLLSFAAPAQSSYTKTSHTFPPERCLPLKRCQQLTHAAI